MNRPQTRRAGVVRAVVIAAIALALLIVAYQYFASSSRLVPKSQPVAVKLNEVGAGQSIVITNADILDSFAKALRSGRSHRLTCECAVAGAFEVRFANGAVLPVEYAMGHDEGRLHINMAGHSYSMPLTAVNDSLRKSGIRMPGLPWDYAGDGIPKWPTNSVSP